MTVYTYARKRKGRFFRNHAINPVMMLSSLIQPSLYPYWAVSHPNASFDCDTKGDKKEKGKTHQHGFSTPRFTPLLQFVKGKC